MSIGLDAVSLERAVRDANVPRSSAYAVWSSEEELSPQEGFQRAVLCAVVEERKRTLERLAQDSVNTLMELGDVTLRRTQFREVLREAAGRNLDVASASMEWKLTIALRSILYSAPEEARDEELVEWLRDSGFALRQFTISTLYRPLAEAFEIVPRPQYGEQAFELCEAAIAAFSEGLLGREMIESPDTIRDLAHPENADGQWTLYAIMCEKVIETFFIPASGPWDDY